jgi:phenylpyruvate tautomerase PptA (4-oxalocrotonate tautomerase family)
MPFVTFTIRRGLSAADKFRLSKAMLEAQVAAGYHRADRFHRFREVDQDDLLVDPRFPDYATDRTDRFMVVDVVISSGRPTGTAATIAAEAARLFGERLHLAPQDILFVFHEVEPNSRVFLLRRSGESRPDAKPSKRERLVKATKEHWARH